jgi:hypothetical protein
MDEEAENDNQDNEYDEELGQLNYSAGPGGLGEQRSTDLYRCGKCGGLYLYTSSFFAVGIIATMPADPVSRFDPEVSSRYQEAKESGNLCSCEPTKDEGVPFGGISGVWNPVELYEPLSEELKDFRRRLFAEGVLTGLVSPDQENSDNGTSDDGQAETSQ